jgi:hypothetical protein
MLPPHLPFRLKVVSAVPVTRGPARPQPVPAEISKGPKADDANRRVRGRRINLKSELRVVAVPAVAAGPRG